MPEAAYLLGFIWGDGCISTRRTNTKEIIISIQYKDGKEIFKICKKVGLWNKYIYTRHHKIYGYTLEKKYMTIRCNDLSSCNFLIQHDFKCKKLSPNKILKIIPCKLHHYFFRGIVDADGSFFIARRKNRKDEGGFSISGPHDQNWLYITKLCDELKITYKIKRYHHSRCVKKNGGFSHASAINIYRQKDIIKIGKYLYQGKRFGLIRKNRKYKKICGLNK